MIFLLSSHVLTFLICMVLLYLKIYWVNKFLQAIFIQFVEFTIIKIRLPLKSINHRQNRSVIILIIQPFSKRLIVKVTLLYSSTNYLEPCHTIIFKYLQYMLRWIVSLNYDKQRVSLIYTLVQFFWVFIFSDTNYKSFWRFLQPFYNILNLVFFSTECGKHFRLIKVYLKLGLSFYMINRIFLE